VEAACPLPFMVGAGGAWLSERLKQGAFPAGTELSRSQKPSFPRRCRISILSRITCDVGGAAFCLPVVVAVSL
jgi:hypothetical protein